MVTSFLNLRLSLLGKFALFGAAAMVLSTVFLVGCTTQVASAPSESPSVADIEVSDQQQVDVSKLGGNEVRLSEGQTLQVDVTAEPFPAEVWDAVIGDDSVVKFEPSVDGSLPAFAWVGAGETEVQFVNTETGETVSFTAKSF